METKLAVLTFQNIKACSVKRGIGLVHSGRRALQSHAFKIRVNVLARLADTSSMRDLLYRLPRFSADFPIDIIVGELAILGVCKNISETGMRGEFRQRLPLQTIGLIRLNHPQQSMELRGKVVHYAQFQMAFHFLFQSEEERLKLCEFARAANKLGSTLKTAALPTRGLRYLTVQVDRRQH